MITRAWVCLYATRHGPSINATPGVQSENRTSPFTLLVITVETTKRIPAWQHALPLALRVYMSPSVVSYTSIHPVPHLQVTVLDMIFKKYRYSAFIWSAPSMRRNQAQVCGQTVSAALSGLNEMSEMKEDLLNAYAQNSDTRHSRVQYVQFAPEFQETLATFYI